MPRDARCRSLSRWVSYKPLSSIISTAFRSHGYKQMIATTSSRFFQGVVGHWTTGRSSSSSSLLLMISMAISSPARRSSDGAALASTRSVSRFTSAERAAICAACSSSSSESLTVGVRVGAVDAVADSVEMGRSGAVGAGDRGADAVADAKACAEGRAVPRSLRLQSGEESRERSEQKQPEPS